MSIECGSYRTYGILGDYMVRLYTCSECGHKLSKEDRLINHCPYCGTNYSNNKEVE